MNLAGGIFGCCVLDISTKLFRDPQAHSNALAALGSLQPRAFGSLFRTQQPKMHPAKFIVQYVYALQTTQLRNPNQVSK